MRWRNREREKKRKRRSKKREKMRGPTGCGFPSPGTRALGMSAWYPRQPLLKAEPHSADSQMTPTKCPLTHQSGDSKLIISSVRLNNMFIVGNN
jgi:hypothetical protein